VENNGGLLWFEYPVNVCAPLFKQVIRELFACTIMFKSLTQGLLQSKQYWWKIRIKLSQRQMKDRTKLSNVMYTKQISTTINVDK
jgi:hypothetical protein